MTAAQNLAALLARVPDRDAVAVRCGDTAMSYGALEAETARVAAALAARGVDPGDKVLVVVEKSPAALALLLGTWRAGAVFVPLAPGSPDDLLRDVAARVRPGLTIAGPGRLAGALTLDGSGRGTWADAVAAASGVGPAPVPPEAPALLIHTSGTTGPRKGAVLTHAALSHQAEALAALWRMTAADTLIHALPFDHAHGLFVATLPVLSAGGTIDLHPRFEPRAVVRAMADATIFMGVPFHYARLLADRGFDAAATAAMRLFVCGSAPLPAALRDGVAARTGHAILNRYGMTECGILTAEAPGEAGSPGCVGRPLAGVAVRIVDRAGAPRPAGEVGAVEVRGEALSPAYLDDRAATAASFTADGWFRTGDEGRLDADGRLTLVGRTKEIVIYCGINIHPLEVETALRDVAGVADAAVFGVPHPDCGEAVVAAVVPGEGADLVPHRVRAALVGRLPEHAVPKRVVVLDELPRTAVGKVAKAALAAAFAGTFAR